MAFNLDQQALRDIEAYAEYRRIVGDDDGGNLFTEEEYEAYKRDVIPMRMKNRLFVTWTNPDGMDCICVGPETECFCQHRYKQHKTDFKELPRNRPIDLPCEVRGCPCAAFQYASKNCGQPVRCHCKHQTPDHSPASPFLCLIKNCKCNGYKSSFSCDCGTPAYKHTTIVETADERQARGHPVGQPVPYKAMGGITGFSSLAAGYMRLDQSGIGAPSEEFLNQPITADDHPFLRSNVRSIQAHKLAINERQGAEADRAELESQMRRPGESELDYYERRYQEREKARFRGGGGRGAIAGPTPVTRGRRLGPSRGGPSMGPSYGESHNNDGPSSSYRLSRGRGGRQ